MLSKDTLTTAIVALQDMRVIGTAHMNVFQADYYRAKIDAAIAELEAERAGAQSAQGMPDSVGWWGIEDEIWSSYEVVEIVKWTVEDDVVTVRYGHAPAQSEDIVQHIAEFRRQNKVKWWRLHMPWQPRPALDAMPLPQGVPDDVREMMQAELSGRRAAYLRAAERWYGSSYHGDYIARVRVIDKALAWLTLRPRPALDAVPQPNTKRELMAMVDELLGLAHLAEHAWEDADYALLARIQARHAELTKESSSE